MKALLKLGIGIVAVFGLLVMLLFSYLSPAERDQLNPFVKEELRYFQVNQDGVPVGPSGMERYSYEVLAYNEVGDPLLLNVTAANNLKHGAYIEVLSKGLHVESWQEVQLKELSEVVKASLLK